MDTSKNVIPAKAGIQNLLKILNSGESRNDECGVNVIDDYALKTPPKSECRTHCHTATIFEVASAIWNKFFK